MCSITFPTLFNFPFSPFLSSSPPCSLFSPNMQVGLVQKLMFLVFLSLLVSAEDTKMLPLFQNKSSISLIGMNKKKGASEMKSLSQIEGSISHIGMNKKAESEMKQRTQEQEQQQQRVAHSLDEFFTSKRRVPNASDPLHNR